MRVYSYNHGALLIAAMDLVDARMVGATYLGDGFDATAQLREVSVFDMTAVSLPVGACDTDAVRQVPLTEYLRTLDPGDLPEVIGGTDFTG